jgi:hypothetical protein
MWPFKKKAHDKSKIAQPDLSGNRAWRRAQAKAQCHEAERKIKRQHQLIAQARKKGAIIRVANRIKKVKARIAARKAQ